jgi:hypothetical protein
MPHRYPLPTPLPLPLHRLDALQHQLHLAPPRPHTIPRMMHSHRRRPARAVHFARRTQEFPVLVWVSGSDPAYEV